MKSFIAITEYKVKDVDVYSNAVKIYTSECGIDTERYDNFDLMPILIFLYDKGEYLWLWDILPLKVKDISGLRRIRSIHTSDISPNPSAKIRPPHRPRVLCPRHSAGRGVPLQYERRKRYDTPRRCAARDGSPRGPIR